MQRFLICFTFAAALGAEWPGFRGPNSSGVADGNSLPREIGPDKNVLWKTVVPPGKSSPAVSSNRIFLTGHENGHLVTFALDRNSGKLLWKREAPQNREEKRHSRKGTDKSADKCFHDGGIGVVWRSGAATTMLGRFNKSEKAV